MTAAAAAAAAAAASSSVCKTKLSGQGKIWSPAASCEIEESEKSKDRPASTLPSETDQLLIAANETKKTPPTATVKKGGREERTFKVGKSA